MISDSELYSSPNYPLFPNIGLNISETEQY